MSTAHDMGTPPGAMIVWSLYRVTAIYWLWVLTLPHDAFASKCHARALSLRFHNFSVSGLCVAFKEDLSHILLPYFRAVFPTPLSECDEFLESVWLCVLLSLVLKWYTWHMRCVQCLSVKHAQAALNYLSDCRHCHSLKRKVMRSRLAWGDNDEFEHMEGELTGFFPLHTLSPDHVHSEKERF